MEIRMIVLHISLIVVTGKGRFVYFWLNPWSFIVIAGAIQYPPMGRPLRFAEVQASVELLQTSKEVADLLENL